MNTQLEQLIKKVIKDNFNIDLQEIKLETPPKKDLGDVAFGCFVLSRDLKKNPAMIAGELADLMKEQDIIDDANTAGPYINIKLSKDIYKNQFYGLFDNKNDFLSPNIGDNKKVIVDYIGMNVGKPMHIGHMCTPNIGQAMINIHKNTGYDVISDSHIGDWGIIFGKLITAYKLWGDETKLKENAVDYLLELYVKITAKSENDDTLEEKARDAFKKLSGGDLESKELWAEFTSHTIEAMNIQLARLGVYPDYNIGESFYEGIGLPKMEKYPDLEFNMKSIVRELIEKGIATKNDDGSVGVIFDDETKLSSCILQKRDGTHGYLASDLACIKYRTNNWNPDKILYFVDVRQALHFRQAFEISKNAGWLNSTDISHPYNGFISGKEGAFSTRKGNIIKLDGLLDEAEQRASKIIGEKRDDIDSDELNNLSKIIGIGAIKYGHLKKSRDTDVIFDWDEFMTFEGNSGPYIQYAYVRAFRILEKFDGEISNNHIGTFTQTDEIELVKAIGNYTEVLKKTIDTNMPHHLCAYSYDLTKKFNALYNNVHILNEEDEDLKMIRLQLVSLFAETLKKSFEQLGITMPEKM